MLLDLQLLLEGESVLLLRCHRKVVDVFTADWLQFNMGNWMAYMLALPHVGCLNMGKLLNLCAY